MNFGVRGPGIAFAFELNESALGVPDPPHRIGDVLSDEQLSGLNCTKSDNGQLVCPIDRYDDRMFGIMVDREGSENRITTAMVFWGCKLELCDGALDEAIEFYSKTLGQGSESLDGIPIWKDREKSRRDLLISKVGERMISVVLVESDP